MAKQSLGLKGCQTGFASLCFTGTHHIVETINSHGSYWTEIQEPSADNIHELGQYHFHRLNLDDCLSKIQIPKIDKYADHIIILHFPVYREEEENKDEYNIPKSSQLSIFVGTSFLVTIHNTIRLD